MTDTLKKILLYLPDKLIDLLWHFHMWRIRRRQLREYLREAMDEGIRRGLLSPESKLPML